VTSVCKVTTDVEDTPDALGLADIDHFAQFVRGTKVPPRDLVLRGNARCRGWTNPVRRHRLRYLSRYHSHHSSSWNAN
jgi:hypothetical protein